MKDCYREDGYIVCFCGKCEQEEYKLPSDFPMTHNTREAEEWEERFDMLFDHIKPLDKHIPAHIDTRDYADIKKFIHQQLQKAREEERERIEAVFKEHVPPHAMDLEDSVWLKRYIEDVVEQFMMTWFRPAYFEALTPTNRQEQVIYDEAKLKWETCKQQLTETLHHQLQKARHDWLREEIEKLEGMLSRWVAAYMPADEGKDPSKWGFKTEKEAWDFIEKRLTPCPLDPRDKSGEPCDSCMAEWMVYQIPEVDQALQTIIDRYHSELDQEEGITSEDKKD